MQGLVKGFEAIGFKPEIKPLSFFQDDYGLKAGDAEGETDDGEEELEGKDDEMDETEEGSDTEMSVTSDK